MEGLMERTGWGTGYDLLIKGSACAVRHCGGPVDFQIAPVRTDGRHEDELVLVKRWITAT